jgi:hypothetical protein
MSFEHSIWKTLTHPPMHMLPETAEDELLDNTYFIAGEHAYRKLEIENGLLYMGLKEYQAFPPHITPIRRKQHIKEWIETTKYPNKNLCRGSNVYTYVLDNIVNDTYTSIFIVDKDKIIGLANFFIEIDGYETILLTTGICVSTLAKRRTGKYLITILKNIGKSLGVNKLVIRSVSEAKKFYESNGLRETEPGTNIMEYKFVPQFSWLKGTTYGGIRKTKKSRKNKRRTYRTKTLHKYAQSHT